MTKNIETIQKEITDLAAQKKARSKKFHEELDKLYDVKRADMKALRVKEAELKKELKTLRASVKAEPKKAAPKATKAAVKPATGTLKKAAASK